MKSKTTLLTKALTLLFVALFSLTGARAESLTVYDGTTTNEYVPVRMTRLNNTTSGQSQFVIPSDQLQSMIDGTISVMTFYANNQNINWGSPEFDVYLSEISESSISALKDWSTLTKVYSGSISISSGNMVINLDTPYKYMGGNLLVGFNQTKTGTNVNNRKWYGQTVSNASVSSGNSGVSQRNFIPKTTFTYTPTSFVRPQDVTATNVKSNSASIAWNGTASSYNLRYAPAGSTATIILTAGDVWGDGSGYQMLLDADATAYGTVINPNGFWEASDYSAFEYTVPGNADCSTDATNVVVNGSVTIQIPAGTYDWCITNPTPDDKIYIASSNGNVGGRQDDYVFEGGKIYEFNITLASGAQQSNDKVDVTITDNSTIADDAWTTVSNATSPYSLGNLSTSTSYRVEVQAVYSGGTSEWAGVNFTTLATNHVVTDVAVTPQSTSANISWVGESDSYQIKYKKKATTGTSTFFFEDFENGLDAQGWTTVRNDGGTTNTDWHQFDATSFSGTVTNHSGSYVAMSRSYAGSAYNVDNWLITPQVTLDGTLKYWVRDDGAYHEHYDVYVSTTGTNLEDFTLFYEPGNASSTWTEVSVDLSSFEGQQGYIALRLTDEDQDFLLIDDFGIYETLSPAGDWMTATTTSNSVNLTGLMPNTEYEFTIIGIKDGVSNSGTPVASFTTLGGDFTVTIGSVGYTTFVAPFNISELPEGLEAYACQVQKTAVHLEPVTAIPAGEAVVLKNAGTWTLTPATSSVELGVDNDLLPSDGTVQGGTTIYALANKTDGVGFYPVSSSIYVPAGKGYLVITTKAKAFYGFEEEDDPTGINIVDANANETIYNVAGQRISKAQKGINIINGKKVLK